MTVTHLRPNMDNWQERVDLAAAFRWTARLNYHEAVANHSNTQRFLGTHCFGLSERDLSEKGERLGGRSNRASHSSHARRGRRPSTLGCRSRCPASS